MTAAAPIDVDVLKSEIKKTYASDLAKLCVAIEHELTRPTTAHTPTEEAATFITA